MSGQDIYAPSVNSENQNASIAILTTDEVHDLELFYPLYRFAEEGYKVDVVTMEGGPFKGKFGMELKHSLGVKDIDATHYQLLYIPGGKAPSKLRKNADIIAFVQKFVSLGKPVAAFCHGPQVLISAEVVKGKRIAAWPDVEKELTEAGATFVNEPTVIDGQFITARWPGDLPVHMEAVLKAVRSNDTSYQSSTLKKAAGAR